MEKKLVKRWNNIIQLYTSGWLDILPVALRNKYSGLNLKIKIIILLKELIADFLKLFIYKKIPSNKIWFFVMTKNNHDTLKEVKNHFYDGIFISYYRFRSRIPDDQTYYFSLPFKFFHDLLYVFRLIRYSIKEKEKAKSYYDLLLSVNGTYSECRRILILNRPKAIIFTNDHLVIARSLLLAANDLGIKTYYIQHASVSEYFPPLEFSYSFLEGQDSLDKYINCGDGNLNSQVYLVGMSKFDKYAFSKNQNGKLDTLGIAFNFTDSIEHVYIATATINKNFPHLKVIIRPHPGDSRDLSVFKSANFLLSNPKTENVFEFLNGIDCLVAGDSSIHLEATLLNINSLYFKFSGSKIDYYGFLKNGLIDYFGSIEELKIKISELIRSKNDVTHRATYYNAAINSSFYGKSTEKIVEIINSTISEDVQK